MSDKERRRKEDVPRGGARGMGEREGRRIGYAPAR
jgi:hypothetical protein